MRAGAGNGARGVLEGVAAAIRAGARATLALVVETEGSTYVDAGGMALFGGPDGQVGWLSGGCLEPEIERQARQADETGSLRWMEVDTRDDEDLLAGSALGCRGRLRIALLPLRALPGFEQAAQMWLQGGTPLEFAVSDDGAVAVRAGGTWEWRLPASAPDGPHAGWRLRIDPPPEAIVFGAGPETPLLLPLLREMGWRTTLVERRERWSALAALADRRIDGFPAAVADGAQFDAALVMHHNFELDREALAALAPAAIAFVGLLGPVRRREDLFKLLSERERIALAPRLRSPIGLKLGGQGPQAIALSIAAQLQAYRHGEETR
ncbi:XshC-Cox1-family protein [Luteimonas gilva]|uniref:XshC-Cox1-family protein n=2 Tax=Luteimonas gilva TaxID=2572684 RepID=A0A4U5JSV2_9GAMM|nr:XshC-Cox1-family protein [Luteimonas gilva]